MATARFLVAPCIGVALAACNPKPSADAPAAGAPPTTDPAAAVSPPPAPPAAQPSGADAPAHPGCAQNFDAFDGSGDERVSLQEFLARPHVHDDPEGVFESRDADADGSLTRDEFCAGWGTAGRRTGMGLGSGMGMGPGMGHGRGRCEEHFARFDANSDGNVSEQEFSALPHPHADPKAAFVARDQNEDGVLTAAEFCARGNPPPSSRSPAP